MRRFAAALSLLLLFASPVAAQEAETCAQPLPVCAARAAVFAISAFDPVGSAVRIGADRLVTSRHVVADEKTVTLYLADGTPLEARPIPNDYPADLILLQAEGLPDGLLLAPEGASTAGDLFTVAADVGRQEIRAYDPGQLKAAPAAGHPYARLHSSAYSQPGNSGGALLDAEGRLVGIVAAGGEGRFEAIPAEAIAELEAHSGPEFAEASAEIGRAVRICTTLLEKIDRAGERLAEEQAKALATSCGRTANRQLLDLAGQTLGREGWAQEAIVLFERALAEDPNAVNSRIALAITYHLNRDFEKTLPHLRWLLEREGDDLQVLRLAIQAGVWGGDPDLSEQAYARLEKINPQSAPAARRFLDKPPPRPQKN